MPNREIVEALLCSSDVRLEGDELDEMVEAYSALLELEKTFQISLDWELEPYSLSQPAPDGYSDE